MADSEVRQKFEATVKGICEILNEWRRGTGPGIATLLMMAWDEAFSAGMRAREIARWIPVEEKLPGEGTKVLALFREYSGSHSPYIHRFAEICEGHWRPEGGSGNFDDRVTHWQPLPAAPEEKNAGAAIKETNQDYILHKSARGVLNDP